MSRVVAGGGVGLLEYFLIFFYFFPRNNAGKPYERLSYMKTVDERFGKKGKKNNNIIHVLIILTGARHTCKFSPSRDDKKHTRRL